MPEHTHPATVREHVHEHITHYCRPGEDVTHLVATHEHSHNHPELTHEHEAHGDADKEHLREAHIHDHASPAQSPA